VTAIFLNGGGDSPETARIDRAFVAALADGPVLYWPHARPTETYAACRAWFGELMAGYGVTRIEMDARPRSLAGYGGVYLGGGDTYRLLAAVRTSGLDHLLVDAVRGGLPVFGGSAGAIVLGADISTWVPAGESGDAVRGLDLLGEYSVWAEYEARNAEAARDWCAKRGSPVIALGCAAGVIVRGDAMYACGTEPVLRIDAGGAVAFADGERIA
jgi:dipeptidase E